MKLKLNTSSSNSKEEKYNINGKENIFLNKEKYKFENQKKEKNEFLQKITGRSDNRNTDQDKNEESDSLVFDDKINFYDVPKKNVINYMTPKKINNTKKEKKNNKKKIKNTKSENNIINFDENDELSDLFSNSSTDNKNVMVSELDIELSNSNYLTEHKNTKNNYNMNTEGKSNNINLFKKREIEFKKEIEQNLKKFLKKNQEKNSIKNNKVNNNNVNISNNEKNDIQNNIINKEKGDNLNIKDNIKMKRLKKKSQNINYCCLTDINNKKNNTKNKQNILSSFIIKSKLNFDYPNHNYSNYNYKNKSFKTQKEFISKNNISKKYNEINKINISKKINNNNKKIPNNNNNNRKLNLNYKKQKPMNYTNMFEIKSKIFYLQNKIKKNLFSNNTKNDLSEFNITHKNNDKKNTLSNFGINSINNTHDDYFTYSEKRKIANNNSQKKNFDSLTKNENYQKPLKEKISLNFNNNINDKNIIIQSFNCIDYNNINININNNIINKPYKFSKVRNNSKKKISTKINNNNSLNKINNYSNFKKKIINNNTISKRGKLIKIKNLCDSYIKNTQKKNTSLNNSKIFTEKNNVFKRIHNEKKLTYKENSDIKNKILNYYLNKKDLAKNKTKYVKINEVEFNKNYNTINNNLIINEETLSSNKKETKDILMKQKTMKSIENKNCSNNVFHDGKKKFIRPRKEKRNTQVCSNNIKKNLLEYKFRHFK